MHVMNLCWGKFGVKESISPHQCNVSRLWGKQPQHRPSSLNTGIYAASIGPVN